MPRLSTRRNKTFVYTQTSFKLTACVATQELKPAVITVHLLEHIPHYCNSKRTKHPFRLRNMYRIGGLHAVAMWRITFTTNTRTQQYRQLQSAAAASAPPPVQAPAPTAEGGSSSTTSTSKKTQHSISSSSSNNRKQGLHSQHHNKIKAPL